jgi:hypothetical protein
MSNKSIRLDCYVVDVLMRDLVGHDHAPSAFLIYLFLTARAQEARGHSKIRISLRVIADETGLSKSAVQDALRVLRRRK